MSLKRAFPDRCNWLGSQHRAELMVTWEWQHNQQFTNGIIPPTVGVARKQHLGEAEEFVLVTGDGPVATASSSSEEEEEEEGGCPVMSSKVHG